MNHWFKSTSSPSLHQLCVELNTQLKKASSKDFVREKTATAVTFFAACWHLAHLTRLNETSLMLCHDIIHNGDLLYTPQLSSLLYLCFFVFFLKYLLVWNVTKSLQPVESKGISICLHGQSYLTSTFLKAAPARWSVRHPAASPLLFGAFTLMEKDLTYRFLQCGTHFIFLCVQTVHLFLVSLQKNKGAFQGEEELKGFIFSRWAASVCSTAAARASELSAACLEAAAIVLRCLLGILIEIISIRKRKHMSFYSSSADTNDDKWRRLWYYPCQPTLFLCSGCNSRG